MLRYPALFDKDAKGHGSNKRNGGGTGLAIPLAAGDDHGVWTTGTSHQGGKAGAGQDRSTTAPAPIGGYSQKLSHLGGNHIITNGDKAHPFHVAGAGIEGVRTYDSNDPPHDMQFHSFFTGGKRNNSAVDIGIAKHVGVEDDPKSPFHGEGMYTVHDTGGNPITEDHNGMPQEKFTLAGAVATLAHHGTGGASFNPYKIMKGLKSA